MGPLRGGPQHPAGDEFVVTEREPFTGQGVAGRHERCDDAPTIVTSTRSPPRAAHEAAERVLELSDPTFAMTQCSHMEHIRHSLPVRGSVPVSRLRQPVAQVLNSRLPPGAHDALRRRPPRPSPSRPRTPSRRRGTHRPRPPPFLSSPRLCGRDNFRRQHAPPKRPLALTLSNQQRPHPTRQRQPPATVFQAWPAAPALSWKNCKRARPRLRPLSLLRREMDRPVPPPTRTSPSSPPPPLRLIKSASSPRRASRRSISNGSSASTRHSSARDLASDGAAAAGDPP